MPPTKTKSKTKSKTKTKTKSIKLSNSKKFPKKLKSKIKTFRIYRGNGGNGGNGGVFCYMPYSSLDLQNKSTFKIESGTNITEQIKQLKVFFPQGFFVIAILKSPKLGKKEIKNHKVYYKLVMDKIIEIVIENGGISDQNNDNGWVNSTIDNIHSAFKSAENMYGGERLEFGLSGKMNDSMNLIDIKNTKNPVYVGKVIFHT